MPSVRLTQGHAQEKTEDDDYGYADGCDELNRYGPSAAQAKLEFSVLLNFFYTVLGTPDPPGQ